MWLHLISFGWAATLTIQPSTTNDALLSAVKSAVSGDTILLNGGVYRECLDTFSKDLIIQGQNGAQIVGNGSCPSLVTVRGGEVQLNGLSFSHSGTCIRVEGRTTKLVVLDSMIYQCGVSRVDGGGLSIDGATVSVARTKFSGNQGQKGAAIFATQASLSLEEVLLTDNIALIGAGVFASASEVKISNSRILGNESKSGGFGAGIALRNGGIHFIQNTTFQSNHAQGKGGAIYLDHSLLDTSHQLTMQNVQCRGNSASFGSSTGGCLYSRGSLSLSVKDSIIADNMSALSGAGLAIHDAGQPLVLENVTLTKNRARGGEGGALLVEASSELNVTPVQILSSTFEDNRAETYGGAISIGNTLNAFGNLEVVGSRFVRNQAISSQSGAGGAIYFLSQAPYTLRITTSEFIDNKAELAGGAVYAVNPQMLWVEYSTFFGNSAQGASTIHPRFGGALMLDNPTVAFIEYNQFCGNTATSTGSKRLSGTGGAIYTQKSERLVLTNNQLWENTAQVQGGGLAVDVVTSVEMDSMIFAANRANNGGAVWLKDSTSKTINNEIAFTQAGVAAVYQGQGTHQWQQTNWYNNAADNGNIFRPSPLQDSNTQDTEIMPTYPSLVVDGICNDQLVKEK